MMTGTPEENDGLAEIRRLLRSLDETSAGNARAPNDPPAVRARIESVRDLVPERPQKEAIALAPADLPIAPSKLPPPPPVTQASSRPAAARPWPLAAVLVAGAAATSGLAIWWSKPDLLSPQMQTFRAANGIDRGDQARPQITVTAALPEKAARPSPGPTSVGEAVTPASSASTTAATVAPRLAQAARSQSAVTEVPRAPPTISSEPRLRAPARLPAAAGQSSAFPIEVDASAQLAATQVLIVKGLPATATLSRGMALATGDWSLSAADAKGLTLTLPASAAGRHQLTIELHSSDGAAVAAVKATLEIATAPPRVTMSDAVRPPEATTLEWLAEAKRLMAAGHIASSRLLLERASDAGLAEAARLLGDTYDPAKLYTLGARGVSGDIQRAISWYERADELGDPQAKARLLALSGR